MKYELMGVVENKCVQLEGRGICISTPRPKFCGETTLKQGWGVWDSGHFFLITIGNIIPHYLENPLNNLYSHIIHAMVYNYGLCSWNNTIEMCIIPVNPDTSHRYSHIKPMITQYPGKLRNEGSEISTACTMVHVKTVQLKEIAFKSLVLAVFGLTWTIVVCEKTKFLLQKSRR